MIKVGICEDDIVCRKAVCKMLEQYFNEKETEYQLREYDSGDSFFEQHLSTDILLLDIEMNGMTGIELKDLLCRTNEDIKILFVTNHLEAMSDAFGKNVYGFLHKPIEQKELEKYLDRVLEDIRENRGLVIKGADKEFVIKIRDIFYFESDDKYSCVVSSNGRYFCNRSLRQWEEELRDNFFFRCHKCYLVNFQNIQRMEEHICMCNGDKIPISRRRGKELKDSYRKYIIKRAR